MAKRWLAPLVVAALATLALPQARAQSGDTTIVDARDALKRHDRARLAADRAVAAAEKHPLAMWVDYWELSNRLSEAQQDELDAFWARWPGTYVEDRLRNDWLLELGRRRDWTNFAAELPRFRMNDDREVACYALVIDQLTGKDVREAALTAWLSQREPDEGCAFLAQSLVETGQWDATQPWRKARAAIDAGRPRAARQAVALIAPSVTPAFDELVDSPARFLARHPETSGRASHELVALALVRMASNDPNAAAAQLASRWERALPADLAAWAWASVARQSALKLQPEAADRFLRGERFASKAGADFALSDETLAWKARAALRADDGRPRWQQVMRAIESMSPNEQRDPTWVYWKARALQAVAGNSQNGEALRAMSSQLMASLAGQLHFYGTLATEESAQTVRLPARPEPLTPAELDGARANPGLARALQLIALGVRNEGVREWNWTLRGMGDRELLAAAQMACDRQVWDRCINTSDRTKAEIDIEQRFPMPFRDEVSARAREIGIDPAYVYGLIRQESRFIMDARSGVGASGLMQIMPATARWTAKKIGLAYTPALINDRDTNLRLGMAYLKLVLDDFGGSQALAAAAYNAGPNRSRAWRQGPALESAIWAETIPFPETRDYVKKVLVNATVYAALLGGSSVVALKSRLGPVIGPAEPATASVDRELP
ncbi:MAG TPA: transglycosylase SLT domain-containing protein [Caldimonas sp.]|nr:transglycosylase SLT domain-containing protein [Caldimonas sp.]